MAVTVENHVSRVEVHFKIVAFHIFDEAFEALRSFLPGFQSENLTARRKFVANMLRHLHHRRVKRIAMICRHKADVRRHPRYANSMSEVSYLQRFFNALGACGFRHQSHAGLHRGNICVAFPRSCKRLW